MNDTPPGDLARVLDAAAAWLRAYRPRTPAPLPSDRLAEDLGMDALDVLELVMQVEKALGVEVHDDELASVATVADLARLAGACRGRGRTP
jgi:acyl carrier protein